MAARVEINQATIREYIRTPDGPVARHFMIIGEAIKARTIASLKPGFPQDWLGPFIVKRMVMTDDGPMVSVGIERTKTKPHIIMGNPLLVFYWAKAGKVVRFRHVHHPGSEMAPYVAKKLLEALETVGGDI
jgi:hypothetical protein